MIYATLNQDYDPYPDFSTIDCRFTAREQGSTDRLFLVPSEMLFFLYRTGELGHWAD